ncbi:MAG TPA: cysteine desulfurase family protein [Pirellulales bacterium]|nr:cysteine desulfurase family protein [Pirellulales bacterium]
MKSIYLDYNATTPIARPVQEAMLPFLAEHYGNPSSNHALGRACHEAVEDARARVAQLLGANRDEIVFTSGGTESNNLALKGAAFARALASGRAGRALPAAAGRLPGHLVISAFEHPAVVEPARFLERLGMEVAVARVDRRGLVDPAKIEAALRPDTLLVSVMHANNEIGVVQPVREIAEICRRRGVLMHADAAQTAGKLSTRVDDLGVDLLSLAGHKMYAPKGVGVLYVRRGVVLEPLLHGAGHESGQRAGTENVPYIVGLGRAASLAEANLVETGDRLTRLRDRLLGRLRDAIGPGLSVNGEQAPRLPNTLSVNFPGVVAGEMLRRIPELCASTGAACHSGSTHLSATLAAIGLEPAIARGTVRLSLGWYVDEEQLDRAAQLLIATFESLR